MITINFKLAGLHCEACSRLSSMKLKKISGVQAVQVATSGETKIVADREINLDEFRAALKDTDYSII